MPLVRIVDYCVPIEERVRAAGFMEVDSRITKSWFPNPPGKGGEELEFYPYRLLEARSVEEIARKLIKPKRPALIFDLIIFGIEDQRRVEATSSTVNRRGPEVPLAAFGSTIQSNGRLFFPFLEGPFGRRKLLLGSVQARVNLDAGKIAFLAVSPVPRQNSRRV